MLILISQLVLAWKYFSYVMVWAASSTRDRHLAELFVSRRFQIKVANLKWWLGLQTKEISRDQFPHRKWLLWKLLNILLQHAILLKLLPSPNLTLPRLHTHTNAPRNFLTQILQLAESHWHITVVFPPFQLVWANSLIRMNMGYKWCKLHIHVVQFNQLRIKLSNLWILTAIINSLHSEFRMCFIDCLKAFIGCLRPCFQLNEQWAVFHWTLERKKML